MRDDRVGGEQIDVMMARAKVEPCVSAGWGVTAQQSYTAAIRRNPCVMQLGEQRKNYR
jgi:hypothetical protein